MLFRPLLDILNHPHGAHSQPCHRLWKVFAVGVPRDGRFPHSKDLSNFCEPGKGWNTHPRSLGLEPDAAWPVIEYVIL
jgi:hypothetical protein